MHGTHCPDQGGKPTKDGSAKDHIDEQDRPPVWVPSVVDVPPENALDLR